MLESEFMRLALGAGAVVGVLAPAVGFFLVQRRQSLTGDGIGHVAFAGVAAGILLDIAPVLTALVAAILGGIAIDCSARAANGRRPGVGARLLHRDCARSRAHLGSRSVERRPLPVPRRIDPDRARSDLVVIAALGAVRLAIVNLYRPLAGIVIDEEGARVAGVPISALNIAVAALAAVTVALSMRVVGILLVAALMVLPVSAAGRIAWSMRSTLVLAMTIGLGSSIVGLTISYYADIPPGGTIVLVAAGAYAICSIAGSVRGR
jgi:zinc transport system permease protein